MPNEMAFYGAVLYIDGAILGTVGSIAVFEGCRWAREHFRSAQRHAERAIAAAETR